MLDNDITGNRDLLEETVKSLGWEEYQLVHFITLREYGLAESSDDREVWRCCQKDGMILLTGNRNKEDDSSLEQTLRDENTERALPVLTIGDTQRLGERGYRERCIYSLLDVILFLDNHLGTARLYIP
jgi:hypothetical protein